MNTLLVGVDVGSTTVKIAVTSPDGKELLYYDYQRHNAEQGATVLRLLETAHEKYPDAKLRVAFCGSGATRLATAVKAHYVQEVVANALAIKSFYPDTRCAIELGGQDAKVVFFHVDAASGQLVTTDMRMNGSCAGGTGAFIDQIAELLHVKPEDFNALASTGTQVYDISGRCGVFAKTDIQPLLNQGISAGDIALSSFHALAKQTIGGLAQGMEINPKVIFEGGPLTFQPKLIGVFQERLMLSDDQIIVPEHPEVLVAHGAALSLLSLFADKPDTYSRDTLGDLKALLGRKEKDHSLTMDKFFDSPEELRDFKKRNPLPEWVEPDWPRGTEIRAWLGIDAGSTTTKFVLLSDDNVVLDRFYGPNKGEPLKTFIEALTALRNRYRERGWKLTILGAGSTGYGENLFASAFQTDYATVETVAHARAARHYEPDASFILDIGGQDMKAINLRDGVVTNIVLNEACSAGCGSFVETYARSLGVPVHQIANLAFEAEHPSQLGSRCTVFMNSSIITEQRNGKTTSDILGGICHSIIENVFTKVVRIANTSDLGEKVVVQGGTFKNDAVLRAFEKWVGRPAIRPPFPGEMGAIGIALLTKEMMSRKAEDGVLPETTFLALDSLDAFTYESRSGLICPFCAHACNRTAVMFSDGRNFITGNRCDRGLVLEKGPETEIHPSKAKAPKVKVPDLMQLREKLVLKDYKPNLLRPKQNIKIGFPRVLDFWHSLPFWRTLFTALGYEVELSSPSTMKMFERGLPSVASDTVCFPAKLTHGHILDLIDKKVDRIFMPMMNRMIPENGPTQSYHVCAVVKGYPMVIRHSDEPEARYNIKFDSPMFFWMDTHTRDHQVMNYFQQEFGIDNRTVMKAIAHGDLAMKDCYGDLVAEGQRVLDSLGEKDFAVVLAGRPYHNDDLINHHISKTFTQLGIPILTLDSLPGLNQVSVDLTRPETTINFHVRMLSGAQLVAENPKLEYVEIVSFGCGHDAVLTDEIIRILRERSDKSPLVIKMDESETSGPINIRVKSFVETVRERRLLRPSTEVRPMPAPFTVQFGKKDIKLRTILIPNVTESFARITSAVMRREGYKVEALPVAGKRAIALGKKYVHNDMCFPAQINVGEFLAEMETDKWNKDEVAFGLAKDHCDCRLANYAVVARKAMDEAGCAMIPIISTGEDTKGMHPHFKLSALFQIRMLWGIAALDVIEDVRRKIRPYELTKGETDEVYETCIDDMAAAMDKGINRYMKIFKDALYRLCAVPHDRSVLRPKVFIIGEFLLNFHPGSNNNIERFLENHGMETLMPHVIYNFHREYIRQMSEAKDFGVRYGALQKFITGLSEKIFRSVVNRVETIAKEITPLFEPPGDFRVLSDSAQHIIHKTFTSGEGWMIAAEILEHSTHGVENFLILQPFGCLPNHVTGRGLAKKLRQERPNIQILALDYDPDMSSANIENRLQMLILTAKEKAAAMKIAAI